MPEDPDEIQRREAMARTAIKAALGAEGDESGVSLFVTHHLEEIEPCYWKKHLSTASPEPQRVLDLLELQSNWGEDNEMDIFDFTLPEEATNYIISVKFDDAGSVVEISMES